MNINTILITMLYILILWYDYFRERIYNVKSSNLIGSRAVWKLPFGTARAKTAIL